MSQHLTLYPPSNQLLPLVSLSHPVELQVHNFLLLAQGLMHILQPHLMQLSLALNIWWLCLTKSYPCAMNPLPLDRCINTILAPVLSVHHAKPVAKEITQPMHTVDCTDCDSIASSLDTQGLIARRPPKTQPCQCLLSPVLIETSQPLS